MAYEIILPKIDEAMTQGKIIEWMKQEGEKVEKGTILFTLETEKVTWEVESPAAGVLSKHLAKAGDVVAVGVVVAYILGVGEDMPQELRKTTSAGEKKETPVSANVPEQDKKIQREAASIDEKIKTTPLAKKLAKELSVDLSMVTGTGPEGRIKREDVERFVESRSQLQKTEKKSDDIVAMSSMRKTIARRMTESFQSVPHFSLTVEVDMHELKKVREALLVTIEKRTGIRITYTDLFIKMVARAVEDNPAINVSWADDALSLHHDINIGLAVNVENGLVVPVLKEANKKSLEEIVKNRSDLVDRARKGKLLPAEMKGGSLTVSNLGMYGIEQFSPIINPPESCILAIGSMVEKQVVREGTTIIRPVTKLTLAIDHRVLDGGSGSRFLQRIRELIETPPDEISGGSEKPNRIIVIGGGPGGYVAAIEAAQHGADVTLIEKDKLGGTCVNRGCIPTKALVQTANLFHDIGRAQEYGIAVEGFSVNFKAASNRKKKIVDQLRDGVSYLMRKNKIKVVEGMATIIDSGRVKVIGKEEKEVSGDKIIIATGSVPSSIPVEGIDGSNVINSDDALEMDSLPESLVIIGGGVIGLEFAQIFKRLNVAVSVVEMLPQILPTEDADIARQLEKSMKQEGIDIYTGAKLTRIRSAKDGKKEVFIVRNDTQTTLRGDKVLVAVGRRPFTDQLGLERLGIATEKSRITVNEYMETNVKNIYAIGDAVGGIMLAHKAMAEGRCAARNAVGMKKRMDYKAIPRCIWTSPEVAAVGLTEAEARKRYETVKTATFPFSANGKAKILGETQGFVKVIAESSNGKLLGVHIVCPHATEMIAESVLGLTLEATYTELSETIHAHPTLSEAIMEACLGLDGKSLHV